MFRFGDPGGRVYGTTANVLQWWTFNASSSGTYAVASGQGRHTGSCLRLTTASNANGNYTYLERIIDSQPTFGCAFAFRCSFLPSGWPIMSFYDGGSLQCDLRINADGTISITRNGTSLGTSASLVVSNTWIHLEFRITFHPTAGIAQLWVNGGQRLNLTNQNTRASANSSANALLAGVWPGLLFNQSIQWDYDDIILYDAQATDGNGFSDITGPVGDSYLNWLVPTGAGTSTQWTPDSGSNYARVNESTPDSDTSYVQSSTVGQFDTYTMTQLPSPTTSVLSVMAVHYARKTDSGYRGFRAALRSGGGNSIYPQDYVLGTSYQYYYNSFGQNPNNGSPTNWTPAAVNSLEAGQKMST